MGWWVGFVFVLFFSCCACVICIFGIMVLHADSSIMWLVPMNNANEVFLFMIQLRKMWYE